MSKAPTAAPQKSRRPFWRRLLKWTVRIVAVLLVLGITVYAIATYWAARTFQAEIVRIRDAHQPLTFDELDAMIPKVSPDQDAGPYYNAAMALATRPYDEPHGTFRNMILAYDYRTQPVTPECRDWAQKVIEKNQIALDMLDRGASLSGCNANVQIQYGMAVALEHMQKTLHLLEAASVRTRLLALQDQGDRAADSLISSVKLARILERQPVLSDTLTQWSCVIRSCADAATLLSYSHPSEASLQKLAAACNATPPITLDRAYMGERVHFLKMQQDILGSRKPMPVSDMPLPESQLLQGEFGIFGRMMGALSVSYYGGLIRAATGDWNIAAPAVQDLDNHHSSFYRWIMQPTLARRAAAGQRAASSHRCVLVAIEIERYRRAHNGQLPNSLPDLPNAASLPKDPFNGQSLSYLKTADAYYIFGSNQRAPVATSPADPTEFPRNGGLEIRTDIAR